MTQYPSPYQQPPPGFYDFYRPGADLMAPARRSSIMMFVLAGLFLACGAGMFAAGALMDWGQMLRQAEQVYGPEMTAQMQAQGATPDAMRMASIFYGALGAMLALAFIITGFFVRRGSVAAAVTGIILTGLVLLGSLCPAGMSVLLVSRLGANALLLGCASSVPLVLCVWLIAWLIGAARAGSRLRLAHQQYAAQYWHYQQQQAAYQQGAYGYGPPVPAPPPGQPPVQSTQLQPPPPPPPSSSGSEGGSAGAG